MMGKWTRRGWGEFFVFFCFFAAVVILAYDYRTMPTVVEYETEQLVYISEGTAIELRAGILSGTSGGTYMIARYARITDNGLQVCTQKYENEDVFFLEENRTDLVRVTAYKHRMSRIASFMDLRSRLYTQYRVPLGTIKIVGEPQLDFYKE